MAKKRAKTLLYSERSTALFDTDTDDEDGTGINMNHTISEEVPKETLDEKKTFLTEFLILKLRELVAKQASARNLGSDRSLEKKKKSVRFTRGKRMFRIFEIDGNDKDS